MEKETVFADGFKFERRDNFPEFIIGRLSANTESAVKFLKENTNERGWVNMVVKKSRGGKIYIALDNFVPTNKAVRHDEERSTEGGDAPF